MKHYIIIILFLTQSLGYAQLNEDFSDGNFALNPVWTGSNAGADFIVTDKQLRSNSVQASSSFYLSTENKLALNAKWEFQVNLQFSTSGSNYTDVYLISDKADLKSASINGYFVRIGNTEDEISLYKRSGSLAASTKIIDGANSSVAMASNTVKVRVSRNDSGLFKLEREILSVNSNYVNEGSITDFTFTTSAHFGIYIQQSSASFFQKHFFDNLKIAALITDTIPPALISAAAIDSNIIELAFSEVMDTTSVKLVPNFSINHVIVSDIRTTADPLKFRMRILGSLNTATYHLSIQNVKDISGNKIGANNMASFSFIKPYLAKYGDIVINEIFSDPSPQVDLPSVEFAELRNNTAHIISLKNWKFSDPGSSAPLGDIHMDPGSFLVLCAKADTAEFKRFGKVLGLSPWPSLNNSGDAIKLVSSKNLLIDSINYSDSWYRNAVKKQGGWTLERTDPMSKCVGFFNWTASSDSSGGTPGRENSSYISGYDQIPLKADSLKQVSDTTVRVYFNKHLIGAALIAENLNLVPASGAVRRIVSDSEFKELTIVYDRKFLPGTDYLLDISNLKDCSGLASDRIRLSFKTNKLPPPAPERSDTSTVIITEIFADPSPEVGLPLTEFIEIFNPSKDTVDLDQWTIGDPITKAGIGPQKILPFQYLILCRAADTLNYKAFGKVLGISPWPALGNSSDQIILKSFKKRVVDSIAYSDEWYRSTSKKQGGWTIEKIDLNSLCEGPFNWMASKDTSGGTPGRKNSVYLSGYDQTPLTADSLKLASDTTIKVYFNKHLDSSTLIAENFILAPYGTMKKIITDTEIKELTLTYTEKFNSGTNYTLSISNIKDCSKALLGSVSRLTFKTPKIPAPIPERADTSTIIITEIFADPSPEIGLPLAEFIEIFNPSTDTIDLNKWILSDASTKALITNSAIAPGEFLILCPVADTLMFKSFGKTKGIAPWPSLGNTSDQITLKSFKQRLVDSVAYSGKWYKDPVKRNGGWSLEKIDPVNNICNGFYNWTSSTDLTGGTPGRINSSNKPGQSNHQVRIDSVYVTSDSTLTVYLNSTPDTSYLKPGQFRITPGLIKAKAASYDSSFKKLYLEFDREFREGGNYTLTADSLFNCSGGLIINPYNQASISIPFIPQIDYPLIINEIFADPTPSAGLPEAEFIELFNPTSNSVPLTGLSYENRNVLHTFKSGTMPAGSYLILCAEKDTLNFSAFGKVMGLPLWPTLSNDQGLLVLKNNKGIEIHKVAYSSSWYKDEEKKKGGFSLEIIDPASVCKGLQNWRASDDPSGGSPGRQNTAYKPQISEPLKLVEAVLTDSISVLLTFNRAIDSLTASVQANFSLNNGVGEPVSAILLYPEFDKVLLRFKEALTRGHIYRIEAKNITDCKGSLIDIDFRSGEFFLPKKILPNDILISEILFNPRPGGADFIEVYNDTPDPLDVQELSLATIAGDTVSHPRSLSKIQLLLESGQYLVISTDPDNIKKEYRTENPGQFLKIPALPPLNDNKGTVLLLADKIITDQFTYTEKMHFQLFKNFEGISLERSSFKLKANESGNFRSATSSSGFATPGYKNSQQSTVPAGKEEFELSSKTFSPDNDGFEDLLQVNYRLSKPGMIANVTIFNDQGAIVKKLLKNFTLDSEGVFTWDGLNEFHSISYSGIYMMYAEIFDTDGHVKRFRKSFALAVKL